MLEALKELIVEDSFKKKFSPIYYEKILCHKNFLESFLNFIPLNEIINMQCSLEEKLDRIETIFYTYCYSKDLVINNLLLSTIPKNFEISSENDILFLIKQYSELLPISKQKYGFITSDKFLQAFLIKFNLNAYLNCPVEEILTPLQQAYFLTIKKIGYEVLFFADLDYLVRLAFNFLKPNKLDIPEIMSLIQAFYDLNNVSLENIREMSYHQAMQKLSIYRQTIQPTNAINYDFAFYTEGYLNHLTTQAEIYVRKLELTSLNEYHKQKQEALEKLSMTLIKFSFTRRGYY